MFDAPRVDMIRHAKQRRRRIIEALRQSGKLSFDQAYELLESPVDPPAPLDEELQQRGLMTGPEMVSALSEYHRCPGIDLASQAPDPSLAELLPRALAEQFEAVPVGWSGPELMIAMSDPSDIMAEDAIRGTVFRPVAIMVAAQGQLQRLITQLYDSVPGAVAEMEQMNRPGVDPVEVTELECMPLHELEAQAERLPTIRMVNQILGAAVQRSASDVHIEPQDSMVQVRLRIDGVLHNLLALPKAVQGAVISRIKLMGSMDIADTRRPQDGRCRVSFSRRAIDLRISSLPTTFGEKIVIRLLDQGGPAMTLDCLELEPEHREQLERMLAQPQGLLLVTGPTGSGKSTTLYSALTHLKRDGTNIVTVEDPVERQISGIAQVAINERAGVTFASALRSILRQDPNVIMVGEIRDEETAEIALQASLTGHLVLSTLHTNDAASTVTRLIEMGVPGHLLSPALIGVISQRLVRRICASCNGQPTGDPKNPKGCPECGYSGFRGRIPIFEIMEVTQPIAALISRGVTAEELRASARNHGMHLLVDDAMAKVERGITTAEEVAVAVDVHQMLQYRSAAGSNAAAELGPMPAPIPIAAGPTPAAAIPGPGVGGVAAVPLHAPMMGMTTSMPAGVAPAIPVAPGGAPSRPAAMPYAAPNLHPDMGAADGMPSCPRILVVDDSPAVRSLLVDMLSRNFFVAIEAGDGLQGIKTAIAESPDLILADVVMPNMDGYELLKHLRSHPRTRHIPVVMLTSKNAVEDEVRGLEVGADDYLPKPVEAKRLLARLHVALRHRSALT